MNGWIGVDLDGTLAEQDPANPHAFEIGEPIPAMVARVRRWLDEGRDVRIFTARVSHDGPYSGDFMQQRAIDRWTINVFGRALPVTCRKDDFCIALYDDLAVQVQRNTGLLLAEHEP
jgi:hypothetical protein